MGIQNENKKENENMIDNKYIILRKLGKGGSSKVYIVREKNTGQIFAAKVLKDYDDKEKKEFVENIFNMEIKILIHLKKHNNLYITNFINCGSGEIKRENRPTSINKYLILECAIKGCLLDYIFYPEMGFGEDLGRLIFEKILKGIQACHQAMVFHRAIKPNNILLDDNFNPKICDFGLAIMGQKKAKNQFGTRIYKAPEVLLNKEYDCSEIDIYSLGVTLFVLIVGIHPFEVYLSSSKKESLYPLIKENSTESIGIYWKRLKIFGVELKDEFKKLFISMVAYEPKNRLSIEDISNSDWMKKLNDLKDKQRNWLEKKLKEEFERREIIVNERRKINIVSEETSSLLHEEPGTKGGEDDIKIYFNNNLIPTFIEDENLMDTFNIIKIKGNLNPVNFMNLLANKINDLFGDNCSIKENKYKLKFNIIFEDENEKKEENNENKEKKENNEDGEDIEDNEEDYIFETKCIIQVKLFENINKEYLLRFAKKNGELEDYFKNVGKINDLVKKIL